jgi:hypothetical protein
MMIVLGVVWRVLNVEGSGWKSVMVGVLGMVESLGSLRWMGGLGLCRVPCEMEWDRPIEAGDLKTSIVLEHLGNNTSVCIVVNCRA